MRIHVSPVEFVTVGAYVVLFGLAWRTVAAKLADRPVGQAMAFIY